MSKIVLININKINKGNIILIFIAFFKFKCLKILTDLES